MVPPGPVLQPCNNAPPQRGKNAKKPGKSKLFSWPTHHDADSLVMPTAFQTRITACQFHLHAIDLIAAPYSMRGSADQRFTFRPPPPSRDRRKPNSSSNGCLSPFIRARHCLQPRYCAGALPAFMAFCALVHASTDQQRVAPFDGEMIQRETALKIATPARKTGPLYIERRVQRNFDE